ncbi:MAG TPA: hypothetical protein PK317_00325, partial [Coprothermobacter proteolyticus]|nr:hypothetical protein [Coprothermobacter proteolyticus]
MSEFKPTFLYIKRHSKTGLLYFGKTSKNPETYLGSGKHWKRHFKKHGKEFVETLWYCLFVDEESLVLFANEFSVQHNIVESVLWANLIPENGINGGSTPETNGWKGKHHSFEHRKYIAEVMRNRPVTENMRRAFSESNKNRPRTDTQREASRRNAKRMGEANRKPKEERLYNCIECGKEFV